MYELIYNVDKTTTIAISLQNFNIFGSVIKTLFSANI